MIKNVNHKTAFGRMAKEYQEYRRLYDPRLYKLLFSILPEGEVNILDIGCGTGKSTEPLGTYKSKKRFINIVGIDPDPAMLKEARNSARKNKLQIEYVEAFADKVPFPPATFHALISGAAFHWFGNKTTISKLKKLLKPKGVFLIFWTQYAASTTPTIGAELFQKYKWKGIPKKFREQAFVESLLTSSGLHGVTSVIYNFSEKRTIPELIGLLKTNSHYAVMSLEDKKDFIKGMTQAYKNALGTKETKTDKLELRICYGYA